MKTDIINRLAEFYVRPRYLEICTTITGNCYRDIDRAKFATCDRLMYRCPDDFSDGLAIDFRTQGLEIGGLVGEIKARSLRYEVILVDPWHEYETSRQALEAALDLVAEDGTIVVHDCLPPTAQLASPRYEGGVWNGLTYRAYLDLVLARDDLDYVTVDTDFGCGIIRKVPRRDGPRAALLRQWAGLGGDGEAAYRFFWTHRKALLRLMSVRRFWRTQAGWQAALRRSRALAHAD
jgi:hypothetical protein